jgi:bifunctional DNase/RNase
MIQVTVQSLGIDQLSKDPVVILQEREGERVLPIWIGHGEASAIAMELAGMKFARPLTHDLAASLIRALGGSLTRVRITRVKENTYFAELMIQRGDQVISVDARPSDSIAIALRLKAPIFASDELLGPQGLELQPQDPDGPPAPSDPDPESPGGGLSAEQLKEYLRGLKPEDLGRFNP